MLIWTPELGNCIVLNGFVSIALLVVSQLCCIFMLTAWHCPGFTRLHWSGLFARTWVEIHHYCGILLWSCHVISGLSTTALTVWCFIIALLLSMQYASYDLFAVSVVGCLLGYSSCLVVWIPLFLDPSDGVFGRFDLAALCGCRTLNFCFLFVCFLL